MTNLSGKRRRALIHLTVGVGRLISVAKETSRQDGYLLTMFRLAHVWRLIKSVQHGSVFTRRQCGGISETTEYSLRTARDVLLRSAPTADVSGFNLVKLRTGSTLNSERTLSQIVMDVELGVSLIVVHFPF